MTQRHPGAPRWRGQAGRIEVWYATLTDPATNTGIWVHNEVVAPAGGGPAHGLGWIALFPPDDKPQVERFGPAPLSRTTTAWFDAAGCTASDSTLAGRADTITWDLDYVDDSPVLCTFPRWAWERELLPAAQVVPSPTARFSGTVEAGGTTLHLDAAPGAVAHIYGHGNAERWAWLHADLGDGDVLELVTAVSTRPGLNRLPPLAVLQLRVDGVDWPRDPLASAPLFRTRLALPTWTVKGRGLEVEVTIPDDVAVAIDYADPDGRPAVCTNSERADAVIRFQGREWRLDGTAHAEVGLRP